MIMMKIMIIVVVVIITKLECMVQICATVMLKACILEVYSLNFVHFAIYSAAVFQSE